MVSGQAAKTAFVFAGGGSLGAVQVGMLKALRRGGMIPDLSSAPPSERSTALTSLPSQPMQASSAWSESGAGCNGQMSFRCRCSAASSQYSAGAITW